MNTSNREEQKSFSFKKSAYTKTAKAEDLS